MTPHDGWDNEDAEIDLVRSQPWEILDDSAANWALRKIDRAQQEIDRINSNAEREIERINNWRTAAIKKPSDDVGFFQAHLIDYRRRLEQIDPELPKTYRLPAGVLSRRKGSSRFVVTNEQAFIEWAERNDPDLYKRTPLVSGLNGYTVADGLVVCRDGEVVPGVERVTEPDRYDAKPS